MKVLPFRFLQALAFLCMLMASTRARDVLVNPRKLEMFVDELPIIPTVMGYSIKDGVPVPRELTIGMFETKWTFHRDLPYTPVFAYGLSDGEATVPGPTIEALRGIETRVRWQNHLPRDHILPWDPTVRTAIPPPGDGGVPAVVHVHGAIVPPASDGNSKAWFTSGFKSTGPNWSREVYSYPNVQEPGNLWYHDHALGLTRVNILAGLFGAYIVRDPAIEDPLGLPFGPLLDRVLTIFDRDFRINGSIYMNTTGNNPSIHPQWQPEYFGNVVLVNGKAWPFLRVRRQKYRFRIINASNARFYRLFFSDPGMRFAHVGSDSVYLERPRRTRRFLLAPSEIADVVVDFAEAQGEEMVLMNDANYPYPSGDAVDKETNGKVMKFVVHGESEVDASHVPRRLLSYPRAEVHQVRKKRYITLYEYTNQATDEPTHLLINGKRLVDPATEKPRAGTTEMWEVINLTDDNHPLHVHLGLFQVLHARALEGLEDFKKCMYEKNDARICDVRRHAVGKTVFPPAHESGWKNVYKMIPGYVTRILVRFAMLSPDLNGSYNYPFDASAEPGYVYHCHIYDHEDNEMMRPLKIVY